MGRGSDPLSPLIQSRLRRTSTTDDDSDSDSSEEEAPPAEQEQTNARSATELTESQQQMADQIADQVSRDLPASKVEPETVEGDNSSGNIDPFEQRLQEQQEGSSNGGAAYSRPEVAFVSAPTSNYELLDPTSTRTGLDTFDNLGRPLPESKSDDDGFGVPSPKLGLDDGVSLGTGAIGAAATIGGHTLTGGASGAFSLGWTAGRIFDKETGLGDAIVDAAIQRQEDNDPVYRDAVNKAAEAREKAIEREEEAAKTEVLPELEIDISGDDEDGETVVLDEVEIDVSGEDPSQPPDDFVDPEKTIAFSEYLREQSGYTGPVRDGDITWDDQQKDSTGGRSADQSDLYGDRAEGSLGNAQVPDGPIVLGDDHDINWGPDANNPGSGLKEDVPTNVGRTGGPLADPTKQPEDESRAVDTTIRAPEGTAKQTEGARAEAEARADRFTIAREAPSESSSTMSALSTGGNNQPLNFTDDEEAGSDEDGSDTGSEDDSVINFTDEETASDNEGETTSIAESSDDDATIVYTPGDGQTADTVSFESGDEETGEADATEDDAAASPPPVFTAVQGRVNAEDLRNLQSGRGFFDDEPAVAQPEPAGDAPDPQDEGGEVTDRYAALRSSDLRVPSRLDDIEPLRTFEPIGASDDDDGSLPDDE